MYVTVCLHMYAKHGLITTIKGNKRYKNTTATANTNSTVLPACYLQW